MFIEYLSLTKEIEQRCAKTKLSNIFIRRQTIGDDEGTIKNRLSDNLCCFL